MRLALVQPSLRREWQLVRGHEVLATLWIQLFRRGGAAEIEGHGLKIDREGGVRSAYVIRDGETGEQLARFAPQGRKRVLELGDRTLEWKRDGFVGSDGEPLLHAKVSSGIMRTNGEVEVADVLPERDALVAAVVASFLLIRKSEDDASAAAGSVAAVG